jgi:hypothetical protein
MKRFFTLVAMVMLQVTFADDITCLNGTIYKNVKTLRTDAIGVTYSHASGIAKIEFTNLPEVVRSAYGYSPEKAQQALTLQSQAQRERALASLLSITDDKIEGDRTYEIKSRISLGYEFNLHVYAVSHDGGKSVPYSVSLHFTASSSDWSFLKYHPLTLLVDGQRMTWSEDDVSHDGSVHSGVSVSVFEQMHAHPTLSQFYQIARARSVQGKLGIRQFDIPYESRAGMRALADYLEQIEQKAANKGLLRTGDPQTARQSAEP